MTEIEIEITKNEIEETTTSLEYAIETLTSLEEELRELQQNLDNIEIDEDSKYDDYIEMLDSDGEVDVAGYMMYPSTILKEVDPTAFNVGLSDFVSCLDVSETDEYKEIEEQIDYMESTITDKEEEIEELKEKIDELEEVLKEQIEDAE